MNMVQWLSAVSVRSGRPVVDSWQLYWVKQVTVTVLHSDIIRSQQLETFHWQSLVCDSQ
jgi:hypothetical protein